MTPLGLIVSELVTNGLKYGQGRIMVRVDGNEADLHVSVEDEGPRFQIDPAQQRGLGMRLVTALAKKTAGQGVIIDASVPFTRVVVRLGA